MADTKTTQPPTPTRAQATDRYGRDPQGSWAVLDYDGNPLPGRWTSEDAAYEGGMAGLYLFNGHGVARLTDTDKEQRRG